MNKSGLEREDVSLTRVTPEAFADLIKLVDSGTINSNTAKTVFEALYNEGGNPAAIVAARGLAQVSDEGLIREKVQAILDANPTEVARFAAGEEKVAKLLMGQVMREVGKGGNPQVIQKVLTEALNARKT